MGRGGEYLEHPPTPEPITAPIHSPTLFPSPILTPPPPPPSFSPLPIIFCPSLLPPLPCSSRHAGALDTSLLPRQGSLCLAVGTAGGTDQWEKVPSVCTEKRERWNTKEHKERTNRSRPVGEGKGVGREKEENSKRGMEVGWGRKRKGLRGQRGGERIQEEGGKEDSK